MIALNKCNEILTKRFILKPITLSEVNQNYAGWLLDSESNKYIVNKESIKNLRNYVAERIDRKDILFLGIFVRDTGQHIGNIKYEPISFKFRYAIMGILIGNADFRARGVAVEVLFESANWLRKNYGIREIILGVSREHQYAIRAYKKVGFIEMASNYLPNFQPEKITMVWKLKDPPNSLMQG